MNSVKNARRYCTQFWKSADLASKTSDGKEEFRVLNIRKYPPMKPRTNKDFSVPALPPRYLKQKVDQDWGSVWPAPRSFHPASVPLPVRMGVPPYKTKAKKPKPDKWANLELMKIPNFLHLTPPVIKRQAEALKKFCTEWPEGLDTKEKQNKNFPVTITSSSYLHSTVSIRDERARIVQLQVPLKTLGLDYHGRDKFLRLVGDRYDALTDVLTLVADRCPLSCQNMDYCHYLLTVLYNESMKTESWETEKDITDAEIYIWEDSPSYKAYQVLAQSNENIPADAVQHYKNSVLEIHNQGEDNEAIDNYKNSVLEVLGIQDGPSDQHPPATSHSDDTEQMQANG